MKYLLIMCLFFSAKVNAQDIRNFYDFKVKAINGEEFDFSQLKGKKVMLVNTASKCGFTPQYAKLEEVYKKYGGEKFVIIGFPANNFFSQEPGTNSEIEEFCKSKYGVTFPIMEKISVKGKDIHPVYKWLTNKKLNGVLNSSVKWNFQKYLIDENGKLVATFSTSTSPDNEAIIKWITEK
ncbi:MAG: glutathione peroxidase [Bacteroidetes bacterium GWA2_30_7]|nr:MAG: glutathione peroxidase [Bacteroidetes bacterium GWA2_30_7]